MQGKALGFASVALAVSACSLLVPLDAVSGGDRDDARDAVAPPADAPVEDGPSDASESLVDAGPDGDGAPDLHPNGTFETGCSDWTNYQATIEVSDLARTGTRSCRVCAKAGISGYFTLDDTGLPGPPAAGARYRAEAWVRAVPATPSPSGVHLLLRTATWSPFHELEKAQSIDRPLSNDGTWQKIEVQLQVTEAGGHLNVAVAGSAAAGACFLVDDVRLQRIE